MFLLRVSIFAAISTRKVATQCLFHQINIQLKYWYLIRDIVKDFTYYGIDSVKKYSENLLRCFCKISTNRADKAGKHLNRVSLKTCYYFAPLY